MKFGFRTPNLKKSFKARTTGRIKRSAKKTINPFYGKKGMGFVNNPKKAVYNKIYHKTSFGLSSIFSLFSSNKKNKHSEHSKANNAFNYAEINVDGTQVQVCTKKEAEFYSAGMLKIANDCANIVNTTKNPEVFFDRYNLLINKLENLSKLERFKCFTGTPPSQNLENILNQKSLSINDFIDRFYNETIQQINSLKTKNAKNKRIENFYQQLSKYNDCMLPENITNYTRMYENLLPTNEDNIK